MEVLLWSIAGILSILLIMKSASFALDSIIRFARKTNLSYYFVGLLIVSIGTSLPEIFTAIISSLEGKTALVLGDAMGATIVDITLVLAMVAVVTGTLKVSHQKVNISWWKVLIIVALPLVLAFDGTLSRIDGAIMLAAFIAYYAFHVYVELKKQKIAEQISFRFTMRESFIFGANIAMLILGTQFLVLSSSHLANAFNIPMYLFGAVFLSICTTSPEFIIELKAIFSKSSPIAFGDIFGSVVCNVSLVLGIATLINPIAIEKTSFFAVGAFMFVVVLISLLFMRKEIIRRWQGILLFALYALFLLTQISSLLGRGYFFSLF